MKLLKTFLSVLIALGFSLTTYAQNDITQAFASGNVSKIENFLGNQIEVSILNGSNVCDKQKAKSLLEDFFRKLFSNAKNRERQIRIVRWETLY